MTVSKMTGARLSYWLPNLFPKRAQSFSGIKVQFIPD
jgi:hypothetical protein